MAHAQFPNKKNKTNAKQVHLPLTAYVGLVNLPIPANASNFSIDVPISTLLATAGRGGQPVPKQTSTSHDVEGIVLTQRVIVRKTSNLEPTTVQSEEVFGLITLATGLYVITFYIINGTTGMRKRGGQDNPPNQ